MMRFLASRALALLVLNTVPFGTYAAEPLDLEAMAAANTHPIVLRDPKGDRSRHLVVVLADNAGTETTDFLVPFGVLAEAAVADVMAVSTRAGPVKMMPALELRLEQTVAEFDRRHPAGADIVIVPALHRADDPSVIRWLRRQAEAGAMLVGICDGVLTLAGAGLLEGRRATGHWYSMKRLRRDHPDTTWVPNQRYVADGQVITTTGVTASIPVSLALVEALGGETAAGDTARALGVDSYGPEHDSSAFGLSTGIVLTALGNVAKFWGRETIALPVAEGVHEVALALAADAWSRTWRSQAVAVNADHARISSRHGLIVELDRQEAGADHSVSVDATSPADTLEEALTEIGARYGERTAAFVAMQLEYPR